MAVAAQFASRERLDISVRTSGLASLLRELDYALLFALLAITGFGIWILRGAVDGIPSLEPLAARQAGFGVVAVAALFVACVMEYRWLNRAAMAFYAFNIVALIVVLVGGQRINGARSWIGLGVVNWQPAETMKLAAVLVCAQWLSLNPERLSTWRGMLVPAIIFGIPMGLILLQPDLGTAGVFYATFMLMMLVGGVPRRRIAAICVATMLFACSAYPLLKPYQKARIMVFINPEADPRGRGYNVIQSKIAIGNGGAWGQGWGEGTQTTLRFLPEHHTDFIFASAIEQVGFAGGAMLLAGFAFLGLRMIRAMDVARDRFGGLVVAGLLGVFLCHLMLNIGMNMGLLPVTGIPLPLVSYGGSFLVTTFVLFGIVLNVASRRYTFVGL